MVTPIMGIPIPLLAEPLILGSSWDRVECQRWVLGMTMGVLRMKRGVVLVGMMPGQMWIAPGHHHPHFRAYPPFS